MTEHQHGRAPNASPNDPEERSLTAWLRVQRGAASVGAPGGERLATLDAAGPRLHAAARYPKREAVGVRLQGLQEFDSRPGHLPSWKTAEDEAECRAGVGRHSQRQHSQNGMLSAEQRAALDSAVPGWDMHTRRQPPEVSPGASRL